MFSTSVIEQIGYYVYFLRDPRSGKVFYVGKGKENRVFSHATSKIKNAIPSEKLDLINEIMADGSAVEHFILRHGLSESTAFEVEAALIDFIGMHNLANLQSGHYARDFGLKASHEIKALYESEEFKTTSKVLLININKKFRRDMTPKEIYEATHESWRVSEKRVKAVDFVIAVYRGLTREAYTVENWYQVGNRWGFNGKEANGQIRQMLCYKSVKNIFKQGASNPIKYIGC